MPGYAIDDTSQYTGKNNVTQIDTACAWDKDNKRLTVFAINRNKDSKYPCEIDIRGFEGLTKVNQYEMYSEDFDKKSSFDKPWSEPKAKSRELKEGIATVTLKPLSWNVIVFE